MIVKLKNNLKYDSFPRKAKKKEKKSLNLGIIGALNVYI